jgi:hypothetical protein
MGSSQSVPEQITNDEIFKNINKLFQSKCDNSDDCVTYNTLGLNNIYGGDACQTRYRYAEYEAQVGGRLANLDDKCGIQNVNSFLGQIGGKGKIDIGDDSDDELDMDEDDIEDDDEFVLDGGNCAACNSTSAMFMSELQNITQLSATSVVPQTGGKPACDTSMNSLSGFELTQTAGCPCSSASVVGNKQNGGCPCSAAAVGGKKQTSEELNIMPFFSSTSGSEYYNHMQKNHRYA